MLLVALAPLVLAVSLVDLLTRRIEPTTFSTSAPPI
jgi:hypothetical protein